MLIMCLTLCERELFSLSPGMCMFCSVVGLAARAASSVGDRRATVIYMKIWTNDCTPYPHEKGQFLVYLGFL